jgi:hypothetical protein
VPSGFLSRLADGEVTDAGEKVSCGVEVDGDGAVGDGFAGDGAVKYSRLGSSGKQHRASS